MPLTATGMRTVMRQLQELEASPIDCIRVYPSDDLNELLFDVDGPVGTPFEAGRFRAALIFDEHYPNIPPKGYFRTKIFHPNVSERGDICVSALKKDWQASLGLRHVLVVIRCLLVEPNPESALNEEAGRLLLEDYSVYGRKAAMHTKVHALRPAGAPRFTAAESNAVTAATGAHGAPSDGRENNVIGGADSSAFGGAGATGDEQPLAVGLRPLESNSYNTVSAKKEELTAAAIAGDKAKKRAAEKKRAALKRI